jgi:uncharacterized membrane protein
VSFLPWLLFLHILGAIIAFGPGFAFAFFGAAAGREPQHANFTLRTTAVVATRMIVPLAVLQGVTGVGLLLVKGTDIFAAKWLLLAIVLYGIALYIAIGLNLPNLRRLIELSSAPPAGGGPPPQELIARAGRSRQYGIAMSGLIVVIVFLMVVKPF